MKKTMLVSGATSGFGKAIAKRFAIAQHRLIITGRRKETLETFAQQLQDEHQVDVLPLNFDVRDKAVTERAINNLDNKWKDIDVLVNNAGLASGFDKIHEGNTDDWDQMIDTNVKGLLYLTKAVVPQMVARKTGHIINIGSTAGKEVYENGNVYCASKHAVDALTKAMRIDLLAYGIKVTQIAPGAAETNFANVRFHGDTTKAKAVYKGYAPMCADDIAQLVEYVTTLPPNLCINDLVVTSLAQANSFYTHREI